MISFSRKLLIAVVALICAREAFAQTRLFSVEGQTISLERAENSVGALLRAFRPNLATGRWDVDVTVTNGSARILKTPLVLRFDTALQIAPGVVGASIDSEGLPFLDISGLAPGGEFAPGQALRTFTVSLGDGKTRPALAIGIYAQPQTALVNLAALQVLSADGAPLEEVTAEEIGPAQARSFPAGRGGWFSLEAGPGVRGWKFSAPGRAPVVRLAPAGPDRVSELASPRLARLATDGPTIFLAGTIPAPIPKGWSPLAAALVQAGPVVLDLNEPLEPGRTALLARWDDTALGWRNVQLINAAGARNVSIDVADAGIFAVLRGDAAPVAPAAPAVGAIVQEISMATPGTLTATGFANPASRTASADAAFVQTEAVVEIASSGDALSSGLSVPCEITEEYQLRDGTRRILPSYRMILVGYQRPVGNMSGSVVARFPLRPFQLLPGEQLAEAIVRVEVIKPGGFGGGIFEGSGGSVSHGTVRVAAVSGDFARPEAVILQEISLPTTNGIAPAGLEVARAFELNVSSAQSGRKLALTFGPQLPNKTYVLARAIFDEGRHGFQPVQRFVSDANGVLTSTELATDGLVGVDGGGQFVLFQTAAAEAVISGVARASNGQAKRGLTVLRGPWTAFSDASGAFRLLAPGGANEVTAIDPTTGDTGSSAVQIAPDLAATQTTVDSAARGPRIVSISPSNNATNVSRVVAIAINFNRPLNPATIVGGGVQLLNATNGVVNGSVTLNLAGNAVTLLPASPLEGGALYRVRVADTVKDLFGRAIEGEREFLFTTIADNFARGAAAEITIYEPGATNLTAELLQKIPAYNPQRDHDGIVLQGSQGTAEPRAKVILVNESTDETATILADADGSFVSTIRGSVQDFISAVVVNANGTQNRIPATRQRFDDGSVGLFAAGGTITSTGPGAPVDLIVEPGSVHGRTVFKIETVATDSFQELMNGKLPAGAGAPLGAFQLTESGDPLGSAADISVPIKLADLGLPPGSDPTNFAFVVTRAAMFDGKPVHQIVDLATYESTGPEGGRVRTQSPPFVGMLARRLAGLAESAGLTSINSFLTNVSTADNPHKGQTATYGILPMQSTGGEKIGGFVRAVTKHDDGSETVEPLGGAIVRVFHLEDEDDSGDHNIVYEGDLVSISDERGNFGFFFKPALADIARQLVATHARFPFQKVRSGPFFADRTGATVVRTELRFQELPPVLATSDGLQRPALTVGHEPALPTAGTGANDGATVFLTAVDDKLVSAPDLQVVSAEDLQGNPLLPSVVVKTLLEVSGDLPARKVRQFRVTMRQTGRAIFNAVASDGQTTARQVQHAISFGVSRAILPADPNDTVPMRVIFSWPPAGGTNVPNLTPITLRFNRPILASLLQPGELDWLTFGSGHFVRRVTPTSDRREITVFYDGPSTGAVRLVVGPAVIGDTGGPFDQNSSESGAQSFEVAFTQSQGVTKELEGDPGAGVVMLGRFGYALERKFVSTQPPLVIGTLRVLDFAEPGEPEEVQQVRMRYPTAMSLIPNYTMPNENGECETNNMLALFSGTANEPKFLQLAKLGGGQVTLGPKLVLSGGGTDGNGRRSVAIDSTITESLSQVVRSRWDPPYLAYFELGADVTSVKVINLVSFQRVAAKNGILESFAIGGSDDGLDQNGDGDFCDAGDRLPTPDGDPLVAPGLAFSVAPRNAHERIQDFDFHAGLGVIFSISSFVAEEHRPRFSTLLSAGETNALDNAFVEFASSDSPRRVLFLPATTLETPTNRIVRDIAVVSLAQGSGDGALAIIDVTVPSAPTLLNRFTLPLGEGTPASIQKREDGLLAVTTTHSTLLVNPEKLTASNQEATHPSIVGRIDASGTGVRDFVADPTGINITYGGDARKYLETAPRFSFVRFNAVINPTDIAAQPAAITAGFLKSATPVQVAEVTQPPNGAQPGAPDPSRHYYVLADIPGGAADSNGKLPLVLAAVDASGMPQAELGGTVVPTVVGDEQLESALLARRLVNLFFAITKVQKAGSNIAAAEGIVAKIRTALGSIKTAKKAIEKLQAFGKAVRLMPDKFEATRLSNNPDDPLYNKFLAGPFIVLGGVPTIDDIGVLQRQLDYERAFLRPSARLWVGLPSQRVGGPLNLSSLNPFTPPESKLKPFVSQLELNPSAQVAGITIPHSKEIIEQLAQINSLPANPITSFYDLGQQITLIVSLIENVPFLNLVVRGDWKPMLVPGAHGLLRVNFNERPMVFVPGFAGSQLEIDDRNQWLGLPGALADRERIGLFVNPDGTPFLPSFPTDAVRFAVETPVLNLFSVYGDWLNHMNEELGLTEYDFRHAPGAVFQSPGAQIQPRLTVAGGNMSQTPVPNLYVFPYDWRLDNQKAAEKLRDYVRLALEMHPDADGIDLVAHSNGGLVSRAYMLLDHQRPLVKRFVTVGTPWLGAPKALSGLRVGDIGEPTINALAPLPAVRAMLQFSPGAAQLLPSKEYFDLGYRPLVEDGFDINTNGVPNEAFRFDDYMEALAKHFLRKPVEELHIDFNSLLPAGHPVRANANGFRIGKPIGDHRGDPQGDVEVHHVVGMGAAANTIGQIRVRGRLVSATNKTNVTVSVARVASRDSEQVRDGADVLISGKDGNLAVSETNQFRLNEELEIRYVCGDGTVPIGSLARGVGSSHDLNALGAQIHPIVGGFGEDFTEHNPMLNSSEFYKIFDDIYAGHRATNIDLFIDAPTTREGTLATITVTGSPPVGSGNQVSYVIDLGDGTVELKTGGSFDSVTVQHRYRQSGDFMVTVGASSGNNVYGITSRVITVQNVAPEVEIVGLDATVNLGDSRIAIAKVRDPGLDDRHSFVWTTVDGRIGGTNDFAVPVTFNTAGAQTVKVAVTDSDGATTEAHFDVNVLPLPTTTAGPNFGEDPAAQNPAPLAQAPIEGFPGGHPEIIVRFNGHAPIPVDGFPTVGLAVKQVGLVGGALGSGAAVLGGVFDFLGEPNPIPSLISFPDRILLPRIAKFLGKAGDNSEYARLQRELPAEIFSIDVAATQAFAAARGNDRPVEVDVLFFEGGTAKILQRWKVANVSTNEGVRLKFDWITREGTLERVAIDENTSPLTASAIGTIPRIFTASSEQASGDRSGPATLGILNPATDLVRILARDNLTVESKISLFAVFDANENGRFDDDIFYPLDTNVVTYARLPKRPFAIVGVDEQGNVGALDPFTLAETRNFLVDKKPNDAQSEYEKTLRQIRDAVRAAIADGFSSDVIVGKFLLNPAHLWVFEQGSGANLWKPNFVQRCNGLYIPGKSDNDYELFLPVKLENPYPFTEQGRLRFVADGPHEEETLRGDWYFKRPTGIDAGGSETLDDQAIVEWQYTMPAGFIFNGQPTFRISRTATDDDLAAGFHSPLTPAEVIARVFTQQISGNRKLLLPDTTFFPERREHFVFGQLHLERPPAFGADPIGDAGTGRQMLMLKWLMEGAYVTANDEGSGANDFSPGAPTLASIYANWRNAGVPLAEGFEWGVFQDFAALKSRPFQNLSLHLSKHGATDPDRLVRRFYDDAALEQQASRIKKLGKAAIRATLARLAGDSNFNTLVASAPLDTVVNNPPRSFEDFILKQARSSDETKTAFGEFANDRDDVKDPPDLGDFLRAKNADRAYLETILNTPGSYERFVGSTFQFLRTIVQTPTRSTYDAYMADLRQRGIAAELVQRTDNLNFVVRGRGATQPGLLALNNDRRVTRTPIPLAVEIYSPGGVGPVNISLDHSEDNPSPAPLNKKKPSLARLDTLQTTIDGAADEDETVADGLDTQEGAAIIEGSDEPTVITEVSAVTGAAIDPTQPDNTIVVEATAINPTVPAPVVSSDPVIFLSIRPRGRESVFLLDDWPAFLNRPQSPRYLLRQTDKFEIQVLSDVGLPAFQAEVKSESDTLGRQDIVLEDPFGIGSYENSTPIQFTDIDDQVNADRIYVKDEEIITIKIRGNGIDKEFKLMVDLGEITLATLKHLDRTLDQKPRFDYVKQFLDPNNVDSFNFFDAGFVEYRDDVAAIVNGGDNPMRRHIQNFADPALPSVGEADILYIHAHGSAAGNIGDHVSNTATTARRIVVNPVRDLTAAGFWRSDAEWAVLDACLTLNPILTQELINANLDPGRIRWETVLSNLNGEPGRRLPHGLVGFERTKHALTPPHRLFLNLLEQGGTFVDAWRVAMIDTAQPWAMLYYRSAEADTVREISQDPAPGDTIVYRESSGLFSDFDCEDCDGADAEIRSFDSIGKVPLQTVAVDWTAAESALRAQQYDPNDFWPVGVSDEMEVEFSATHEAERVAVAKTYHWQKALSEDARVAVRIGSDGSVEVVDAARPLRKGGHQ